MSDSQNGHHNHSLPTELQLALRSATWDALLALQSLRVAVQGHVQDGCARGLSHEDVDDGLRTMITQCGPALDHLDYSSDRTDEITLQVLKWSATYYRPMR